MGHDSENLKSLMARQRSMSLRLKHCFVFRSLNDVVDIMNRRATRRILHCILRTTYAVHNPTGSAEVKQFCGAHQ